MAACVVVLVKSPSARGEETGPWEGLGSDDEIEVVRTLVEISRAGARAVDAEARIVKLMEDSARGKRLSRWCLSALVRVGVPAERHLKRYMVAVRWCRRIRAVGGVARMTMGDPAPPAPELPESLEASSDEAWETCFDAVIDAMRSSTNSSHFPHRAAFHPTQFVLNYMARAAPRRIFAPKLLAITSDKKEKLEVRAMAARVLSWNDREPETIEAMSRLLREKDSVKLRKVAVDGLLYISHLARLGRDPSIDKHLALALDDPAPTVRLRAAAAFAATGESDPRAVATLVKFVTDEDTEKKNRRSALGALAATRSPKFVPIALKIIKESADYSVRSCAVDELGDLGGYLAKSEDVEAFKKTATQVVPTLQEVFRTHSRLSLGKKHNQFLVRRSAIALGYFARHCNTEEVVRELRELLERTKVDSIQESIVAALGNIGPASTEAVPLIVSWAEPLLRAHYRKSEAAARALGKIGTGGEKVEDLLVRMLTQGGRAYHLAEEAATALGVVARDTPQVMGALRKAAEKPSDMLQKKAREAMERIGARSGQPPVEDEF